jgi:acetoin utilization protein AcuB
MLVRNWMRRDFVTVTSDTLVSQANRILAEKELRALPVVDEGRLRGLITRKMCLRAAENAMRGQGVFEFQYFTGQLRVKDLMVRNPLTVDAGDTMENCLRRGQEHGVSQFPVLEGGKVVGLVSATEIFSLAAHMLGVWDASHSMTLEPLVIEAGTLARLAKVIENSGGICNALITIGNDAGPRRIVVRFSASDAGAVVRAVEGAGFRIMERNPEIARRGRAGSTVMAAEVHG